ncbi:hypothetical protein M2352_002537 [Azospirillum fermentarium]|uniref:hypothetical protein n=1 Tax=Azospirillum fermentarium TaxID=1233114 RepID=UPI00222735BB|nr:hypothetical protein [Azospirillum fermentarium]MCW2246946.1 hypothetical protein [Azospirillum fermentarium]
MRMTDAARPAGARGRVPVVMAAAVAGLVLSFTMPCPAGEHAGGDGVGHPAPGAVDGERAGERKTRTGTVAPAGLAAGALTWCNGIDAFVDPSGFEKNALMDRNVFLSRFSERNGCRADHWPPQQRR